MFHMLTCGENEIRKVIAINAEGKTIPPCGACREFMAQLMPGRFGDVEIMVDYENKQVASLHDLVPEWWS